MAPADPPGCFLTGSGASQNGLTALLAATSAGHTDIVKLLLERGADVDCADSLGVTPLFMACEAGDVSTVVVLLGFSPDLSIREDVRTIGGSSQHRTES